MSEPADEPANPAVTPEAIEARGTAAAAAMEAVADKLDDPEHADVAEDLLRDLRVRAKRADQARRDAETGADREAARLGLRLAAVEAARAKLLAEHKDELESEAMSALVAELDLEEQQIRVAMGEH